MSDSPNTNTRPPERSPADPVSNRTRRWTVIIAGLLIAVWCVAMLYRVEIRAHWWARQLARAGTLQEQNYYLLCLRSVRNSALGAATGLVRDANPRVRELGVMAMDGCSGPEVERLLVDLLGDSSDDVADAAALSLTDPRRGGGLALIPSLSAMVVRDGSAGRHAVVALQRIPGQQTELALVDALSRASDPDLTAQLLDSLGMIAGRQGVPRMIMLLDDRRPLRGLPYSERAVIRALSGARSQLMTKGLDQQNILAAMPRSRTVADVALRSLQIIAGPSAPTTSSAPAGEQDSKTLRAQWENWWQSQQKR
jgi:hypothetical protein